MFNPKPPSEYEIHLLTEPMPTRIWQIQEKREKVIMAALKGGQHIDAAIEAADRLYPDSETKKYEEDYLDRHAAWEVRWDEIRRRQINEVKKIKSWWPF